MKFIGSTLLLCSLAVGASAGTIQDKISDANLQLEAMGKNYQIGYAEYITLGESGQMGREVFFDSQCGKGKQGSCNKQLSSDWVPGDTRREWNALLWGITNADLTVAVDDVDVTTNAHPGNTLAPGADLAAYHNSNATWENVACSDISLIDLGNTGGFDLGVVQFIFGYGGFSDPVTDLVHAGMLPSAFFDLVAPGGSEFILGVTYTFIWFDAGVPTDIDNNRKTDTAIREIYYNENFGWQDNPNDTTFDGAVDLESVALHEMGHGLSQAHFGQGFFQDRNKDGVVPNAPEEIITTPTAVMNAAHTVAGREITGTDMGGHCSNWGEWPSN